MNIIGGEKMKDTLIETEKGLKRDIGYWPALSIVIGTVIGAGVFVRPADVLGSAGGVKGALCAWIIGGICVMAGGLTIAELGASIPRTGGIYAYLQEIYGEKVSYLFGWMQTVIFAPATFAALSLYFSAIFIQTFGLAVGMRIPIAGSVLFIITMINITGAKYAGYVQTIATAIKLVPIILLSLAGLIWGKNTIVEPGVMLGSFSFTGLGMAMLATFFAYEGFSSVAIVAGEMKNPIKIIPKAIFVGVLIVIVAYLAVNLAIFHTISNNEIILYGKATSAAVAMKLFGSIGGKLINVGILVSMFGTINGYNLTLPRVPYAMACRKQIPFSSWFGKIHKGFGTPINSIMFLMVFALFELTVDADWLANFSILSNWLFYILTYIGLFLLRRNRPNMERPYKVPLYPIVPFLALLGGLFVFIATLIRSPGMSFMSLFLTLLGLPVFWVVKEYYLHKKSSK